MAAEKEHNINYVVKQLKIFSFPYLFSRLLVLIEIKRGTMLPRFADEKNPREKEDKKQSYNKIK